MAHRTSTQVIDPNGRYLATRILVTFHDGNDARHVCYAKGHTAQSLLHGSAVSHCESDQDGALWVKSPNDEYGNCVAYCPFCGHKGGLPFED